ncbi:MAG: hypothetical protein ACYC6L_17015, partial [Anaerolineae bacterium]
MANIINRNIRLVWVVVISAACIVLGVLIGSGLSRGTGAATFSEADRTTWIQMTSDAYALNGDIDLARQRLNRLVDDTTTWKQLAAMVEEIAAARQSVGDAQGAQRLAQMSDALNLPGAGALEQVNTSRQVELWRILLFIGVVLVFLALIAAFLWYMAKQSLKRQEPNGNATSSEDAGLMVEAEQGSAEPPVDLAPSHALSGAAAEEYAAGRTYQQIEEINSEPQRVTPTPKFQAPSPQLVDQQPAAQDEALETVDETSEVGVLGTFEAEYTFGTDDFDCSFTITTQDGVFMGDCGVGVSDVLPAIGPQHVDALELWLFDKGDVSSVSKFIVSEYAYESPTLNNRLSAKGDLVLAEPGAVIQLETRSLRITAQVLAAEYD